MSMGKLRSKAKCEMMYRAGMPAAVLYSTMGTDDSGYPVRDGTSLREENGGIYDEKENSVSNADCRSDGSFHAANVSGCGVGGGGISRP